MEIAETPKVKATVNIESQFLQFTWIFIEPTDTDYLLSPLYVYSVYVNPDARNMK